MLYATGQNKKLWRAGIATFAGIGAVYVASFDRLGPMAQLAIGGIGVILAVVGTLVALYSVRCPKCDLRWVYWAVKTQAHTQWLHWLYEFEECPKCHHGAS